MPEASVLIVNYRTEELVSQLLDHLAALDGERPESTVVVDNSPERGLAQRLAGHALAPAIVAAPYNLGFAGGVNLGLSHCHEPAVILLNPDARPQPGCLAGLMRALDELDAWVAAPALIPWRDDEPPRPSATRCDPNLVTTLAEHTAFHRLLPRGWLDRRYFLLPGGKGEVAACAMVQGACMAARRRIFDQLGGLDAGRFFLYWEETDFCRRVRLAGGRVLFCPHLHCRHLGGASAAQAPRSRFWFWRGLYAYHRKHRGPAYAALIWTLLIPGIAAEWLVLTALHGARRGRDPKLRSDRRELAARLGAQLEILARSPPEVEGGR